MSSLKSQLQNLKASQKNEASLPSNSEGTFLFDFHDSRRIDLDTVFSIGYSGLVELARGDQIFLKYFKNIFNSTAKYFNRDMKTQEELKQIDIHLHSLLSDLSPYFKHKACHRVLETLIKIYKVHVFNWKNFVLSFIPYHETKYYTKLIQNVNFENLNSFIFFNTFAKNGLVILKENFYKELTNNKSLLREVTSFYEENLNSFYFDFLSDFFIYMIGNKKIDINSTSLILQILSKTFKIVDDNLLESLNKLMTCLCEKVKLSFDYSRAILNDYICKVLVVFKEKDISSMLRVVISILLLRKDESNLLTKESLEILDELADTNNLQFNSDFEESSYNNLFTLISTIMLNDNFNNNSDLNSNNCLVIKILKQNFEFLAKEKDNKTIGTIIKLKLSNLSNITKHDHDHNHDNNHDHDDEQLIIYLENTYTNMFNQVLIEIITNSDPKSKLRVKEIVSKLSETYSNLFEFNNYNNYNNNHDDHYGNNLEQNIDATNPFTLFLSLSSNNLVLKLNAIKFIDKISLSNNKELLNRNINALSNLFNFLNEEVVLDAVLSLETFDKILKEFPTFKNDLVDFYTKISENEIKLYSHDFVSKLESKLIVDLDIQVLFFLLFNRKEVFENNIGDLDTNYLHIYKQYILSLSGESRKSPSLNNKEIELSIINFLSSHSHSNLNATNLLTFLNKLVQKGVNKFNLNKNRLELYLSPLLNSVQYSEIILFRNIIDSANLDDEFFEMFSEALLNNQLVRENQEVLIKSSNTLIRKDKLHLFSKLLDAISINDSNIKQTHLAKLMIDQNIHNLANIGNVSNFAKPSFYKFISDLIMKENRVEFSLIISLIYNLSKKDVEGQGIFTVLENCKNLEIKYSNLFLARELDNVNPDLLQYKSQKANVVQNLIKDLVNRKNEILLNRNFLASLVFENRVVNVKNETELKSMTLFILVNQVFIFNMNAASSEILTTGLYDLVKYFKFPKNKFNTNPELSSSEGNLIEFFLKEYSTIIADQTNSITAKSLNPNIKNKINPSQIIQIIDLMLQNILILLPSNNIRQIFNFVISSSSGLTKWSEDLLNCLFTKDNINIICLNLKTESLKWIIELLKFAFKFGISAEIFIQINLEAILDYWLNNLSKNSSDHELISYIYEIILSVSEYNLRVLETTISIITDLNSHKNNNNNNNNNSLMLNLTDNLLTMITHANLGETISIQKNIRALIDNISCNIFTTLEKLSSSSNSAEFSLEYVHIINTLFLCINKTLVQFMNIQEERQSVLNLINRSFEKLNTFEDEIANKDEVYLSLIMAVKNFLELLLNKTGEENQEIYFEYLHHFIKMSLTLNNLKFRDGKIAQAIFSDFIQNANIKWNDKILSCIFVNIFYFTNKGSRSEISEQIIFSFFNNENEAKNPKFTKLCLEIILSILNRLAAQRGLYYIENNHEASLLSLNLVQLILEIIENQFFNFSQNDSMLNSSNINNLNIFLNILIEVNSIRKNFNSMESNEDNKQQLNILKRELKIFEDKFLEDLNEARLLSRTVMDLYSTNKTSPDKNFITLLLQRYLDIIITNPKHMIAENIFEFFAEILIKGKEKKIDNKQIMLSIMTKCIEREDPSSLVKFLKSKKVFDSILSLFESFEENLKIKDTQNDIFLYNFTVLVLLMKIFTTYPNKFLDKFNSFLEKLVLGLKILANGNEEIVVFFLRAFKPLAEKMAGYFSPFLNELTINLLNLINPLKNYLHSNDLNLNPSLEIHGLVNKILEIISSRSLLDNTFTTCKFVIKHDNNLYNTTHVKFLMHFLKVSFNQSDKLSIAGLFPKILKFFIKLLLIKDVDSGSVLDCFRAFILKINEKQLKVLLEDLLKFGKEKSEDLSGLKYNLNYSVVTFEILNQILKTISSILVPYFEKYKSYLIELLTYTNAVFSVEDKRSGLASYSLKTSNKKKTRIDYDEAYEDKENRFSYLYLNARLLENIQLNFKYNSENLLLNESIESLFEPLIGSMKFIFFEGREEDLFKYFDDNIRTCYEEVFKNLKSEDSFKEFNDMILNLVREDHPLIKLITLKMISALFDSLKERYVMQVQDVLPYVADLLEDSNERVSKEAYKVMKNIEKITGEDMKNYLDNEA